MALDNTHFGYEGIKAILGEGKKRIFFAGVGGVSMSSLAKLSVLRGHDVAGYDRTESALTRKIAEEGVRVVYTSEERFADESDAVVYTVAMKDDDPVIRRARETGKPLISRADYLGYLMKDYPVRIGVSGMHGKSTATAITYSLLEAAGFDPTVFGGARMRQTGECNVIGGDGYFVFEACEYMGSFLDFYPTLPVVLNIDMDHPDYFKSIDMIIDHFAAFLKKADLAVVNGDDANVAEAARRAGIRTVTFGGAGCDFSAQNVKLGGRGSSFDVTYRGELLTPAEINVPGEHVVKDALAAAAAAVTAGASAEAVRRGLANYRGIMRRMEYVGKTARGADVYDDYAHHPTELGATLKTAANMGYDRLFVVFQPHTFSRTKKLFSDFAEVLSSHGAELVVLAPIYPARETNIYGVSSDGLADAVSKLGARAVSAPSLEDAARAVESEAKDGDCVLVAGAGDIDRLPGILAGKR
ncbi:MAG: UDP-N-acetylmuramate--L-alanine ligase [Clostridia bacterium]|nr:UDP-N-acetylmuramate--L-alanine ligase [Clostridia bacterium]